MTVLALTAARMASGAIAIDLADDAAKRIGGLNATFDGHVVSASADGATVSVDRSTGQFSVSKNGNADFQKGSILTAVSSDGKMIKFSLTLNQGSEWAELTGRWRKASPHDDQVTGAFTLDAEFCISESVYASHWGSWKAVQDREAAQRAAQFDLSHFSTIFRRFQGLYCCGSASPAGVLPWSATVSTVGILAGPWGAPTSLSDLLSANCGFDVNTTDTLTIPFGSNYSATWNGATDTLTILYNGAELVSGPVTLDIHTHCICYSGTLAGQTVSGLIMAPKYPNVYRIEHTGPNGVIYAQYICGDPPEGLQAPFPGAVCRCNIAAGGACAEIDCNNNFICGNAVLNSFCDWFAPPPPPAPAPTPAPGGSPGPVPILLAALIATVYLARRISSRAPNRML